MGWACWRANSSLSPRDDIRRSALDLLAGSLACNDRQEDALAIQMATLDMVATSQCSSSTRQVQMFHIISQ